MINAGMAWVGTTEIVGTHIPLTVAQKGELLNELTLDPLGRGYDVADVAGCFDKLHAPFEVPNTDPQVIDREFWEPDELKNLLMQTTGSDGIPIWIKVKALASSADPQTSILGQLILETFTLKAINLKNPLVNDGLNKLVLAGILTQAQLDGITKMDAPNWRPTKWANPRVQTLFGDPSTNFYPVIHPMEIAEVMNGNS